MPLTAEKPAAFMYASVHTLECVLPPPPQPDPPPPHPPSQTPTQPDPLTHLARPHPVRPHLPTLHHIGVAGMAATCTEKTKWVYFDGKHGSSSPFIFHAFTNFNFFKFQFFGSAQLQMAAGGKVTEVMRPSGSDCRTSLFVCCR